MPELTKNHASKIYVEKNIQILFCNINVLINIRIRVKILHQTTSHGKARIVPELSSADARNMIYSIYFNL